MVRIEPSTGPAQGVHTRPSVVPSTKPPILPWRDAALPAELLANPLMRIDSHSNGAGQIISAPNTSSRIAALVRSTLGSKSKMRVSALNSSAAAENEITNPSAIIAGRGLPVVPTDAPSRIGSTGTVQGAAVVTTPASRARTRLNIGKDPSSTDGPSGDRSAALLRTRHVFVTLIHRRTVPEYKTTRRGASRPRRPRLLGAWKIRRLEDWSVGRLVG